MIHDLKYNHAGTIDCKFNHTLFGWIPCTLSPDDPDTQDLYNRAVLGEFGPIEPYEPPVIAPEEILQEIIDIVWGMLDAKARELDFIDIRNAVTYADEPAVPLYQQQAKSLRAWRSLLWAKCDEIEAAVRAGERTMPTIEEVLSELPEFVLLPL